MPKAIITGGTGYIGSHLVRRLINEEWEVALITHLNSAKDTFPEIINKLSIFQYSGNISELINFFQSFKADAVFHLAAAVLTNPSESQIPVLIDSNIKFGTEILEAMVKSDTKLFISTGTYWQNYNGFQYNPVDLYASTKEAFEKILKYYTDALEIRAITLRLYDVYGQDDTRPKIWNLLRDIAGTDKCIDMSPGLQEIDLVDVSDIVEAYLCAYYYISANTSIKNEVFSVRTGISRTLCEVVNDYKKFLGKEIQINWGGREYKKREMMKLYDPYETLPNWQSRIIPFK